MTLASSLMSPTSSLSDSRFVTALVALLSLAFFVGCTREESTATSTFYGRKIGPILEQSCSTSPTRSSCHALADDHNNALGNLAVDSYEELAHRRDLLLNYGPYGIPGLLLKVVPDFKLSLSSYDSTQPTVITTNIAHAGDSLVDFASPTFTTLEKWMAGGAAENNAPQAPAAAEQSACSKVLGDDPLFDPSVDPTAPDFQTFKAKVNPILGKRCAGGNCHGSPANSLRLTCGATAEEVRWNYFAAGDYVSREPSSSELLLRTLSPNAGGTYHEGGSFFSSVEDSQYQGMLGWATEKGGPSHVPAEPGFQLFATRVQPMLVKRGCMMLGCHSASMFHDYRLRGGSGGHFGLPATRKNYQLSLEQLALESSNPNTSRLIQKNLPPAAGGMLHRGGPLFASANAASCDRMAAETGPLDEQSPYCVLVAWIRREREARLASLQPFNAIVYVKRATPRPGPDTPQDWEVFAPGADVVRVAVTAAADGTITPGAETSLSSLCGLTPASSDARRPEVSWDGLRVAFAARAAASQPYRVYVVENGACRVDPEIDAPPLGSRGEAVPDNGELIHNLDPSFAPDGRIVFISTRGNLVASSQLALGPHRTPADPSKLNTNAYIKDADGTIRQLTFLLNQEMLPSFMRDGRAMMTTEKRAPEFYQLAGRRINLDGGDYHPLFGQRATIGFNQLTSVVELANKNFAAIFSNRGAARGAGTVAIINRSIGIDQRSSDPADYTVDPAAIDFPNPAFFQRSISIPDGAATGVPGPTRGAYAWPSPLPDGRLLVSYAADATDVANFAGGFDVVALDPATGERRSVVTGPEDALWPVAVYARQNLGVFQSRLDEANGATRIDPARGEAAEMTVLDGPLLASLLFQNTRSGRPLPDGRRPFQIWQSLPPEPAVKSFAAGGSFVTRDQYGDLYVRRALLGELPLSADGSARVQLPGGMPFVLATEVALAGETSPTLHFQREEMQVYPGEALRQSFPQRFFNGLCGGCHGSISGLENEVAVNPDILTRASDVQALDSNGVNLLTVEPQPPRGPPFP